MKKGTRTHALPLDEREHGFPEALNRLEGSIEGNVEAGGNKEISSAMQIAVDGLERTELTRKSPTSLHFVGRSR